MAEIKTVIDIPNNRLTIELSPIAKYMPDNWSEMPPDIFKSILLYTLREGAISFEAVRKDVSEGKEPSFLLEVGRDLSRIVWPVPQRLQETGYEMNEMIEDEDE
ncbi:MAG: hypothetical protein ACOYIR_00675 [Christensenellales bacterium]|jgi:hypothetical protein